MSGANVRMPLPLTRFNTLFPGQFGVLGTANETGLRQHSTGAIFYVDPNYPGVVDNRDGTDPNAPLATVQAAIAKCESHRGDIILVMDNNSWYYGDVTLANATRVQESVVVDVPGVSIIGVAQASSVGVPWEAGAVNEFCITVTACDVLIEGFVFTGDSIACDGIYAEWDGVTLFADNLTVRNCLFDDTIDTAIQLEYAWFSNVHDCFFEECDVAAIYVDPAGSGIEYCDIYQNWFQDCALAASLQGAGNCRIRDNHVYNGSAQNAALATDEGIDTTGGGANIVANNWFSCALPAGANGDYDDLNTAAATDAWVNNHCMNGDATTNPT